MAEAAQNKQLDTGSLYGVFMSCLIMYNNVWRKNASIYGPDAKMYEPREQTWLLGTLEGVQYMVTTIKAISAPLLK